MNSFQKNEKKNQIGYRVLFALAVVALVLGVGPTFFRGEDNGPLQIESTTSDSGTLEKLSSFSLFKTKVEKAQIAQAIAQDAQFQRYPEEAMIPMDEKGEKKFKAKVKYSMEKELQAKMESLFRNYEPDYGAFVALDPATGRVLSIVSYQRKGDNNQGNWALKSSFPSASVFKVVTAAAAIETKKYNAYTVIPFNGRSHTLYRNNVFKTQVTRYTQFPTLREAFAKSINTVFGKIGALTVGPTQLQAYADRFGFNRTIASDLPMQQGRAPIPKDSWGVAEAASGYTRENTMSPLQGAMIAASIANQGVMMEPYVVEELRDHEDQIVYEAEPKIAANAVDSKTASEVMKLMEETVERGTSRGSFRGFFRNEYANLHVGGKTGSLTALDPKGKVDWFVGFARGPQDKRLAVAALTVHRDYWRVKSSYIARKAFEHWFKRAPRSLGSTAKR